MGKDEDLQSLEEFPRLADLVKRASAREPLKVAVAYPCSADSLAAALDAGDAGLIEAILVGPSGRMAKVAAAVGIGLKGATIVETPDDPLVASRTAAGLVAEGRAAALMKGSQHTDQLLSAVLARDADLRTGHRISHVFWIDLPSYHKPIMLTDGVVNIAPTLAEKADIIKNAIEFASRMGVAEPKVALLSAIETVNPALQSSLDAAALCKMADRGQFGGPAIVDGPLALDNALSCAAAKIKNLSSPVAGDPDLLVVPDLDVGNALYKSFVYAARADCAGLVLGAKAPIILTSRADSRRARIASCALARLTTGGP